MSYLRELLCVFTDQELKDLQAQDFTGNEKIVLQYLCERRANVNADDEFFAQRNFSRSYFDKLTSILYNKCLLFVSSPEPYIQLSFLVRRHLHPHIYHQLKIQQRAIDSGKLQVDKSKYYFVAFKSLRQMGFEYYKPEKVLEYGEYYLQSLKKRTIDEVLSIELMHLSVYLQYMRSMGKGKTYEPQLLARLAEIKPLLQSGKLPRAEYYYYNTVSWFHVHYSQNHQEIVENLKNMLAIYEANKPLFVEFDRVFVVRALAEAYYDSGDYEQSFKLYEDLWKKHYDLVNTNYYHQSHYHDVAMITGRKHEAEYILKEIFSQTLKFEVTQSPKMSSIFQHIKHYLLNNQVELAVEYLNEGITHNNKNIMILDEISLRIFQVACFVLTKDFALAQQLISRHKKFLGLKKLKPEDHVLYQFFDIANQIIRYHQKGIKPTTEKLEAIKKLHQGKLKIFGIIVDKMMGD